MEMQSTTHIRNTSNHRECEAEHNNTESDDVLGTGSTLRAKQRAVGRCDYVL